MYLKYVSNQRDTYSPPKKNYEQIERGGRIKRYSSINVTMKEQSEYGHLPEGELRMKRGGSQYNRLDYNKNEYNRADFNKTLEQRIL